MLLFYFIYLFILAVLVQLMRSSFPDQGTGQGFPGGASGKEPTCQYRRHKRGGFGPRVREIPWRRAWQPNSVCLPGKSHGQRKLAGYSLWGGKESDTAEQLSTLSQTEHYRSLPPGTTRSRQNQKRPRKAYFSRKWIT